MVAPLKHFAAQNAAGNDVLYPLIEADGLTWEYPQPSRIVAIGDLHGDLKAFAALTRQAGLIDGNGHWIGKDSHLVLLGDLVGGHKDSRYLLDMIMRLEIEALAQGGQVHALLGNHDLLPVQGRLHGMTFKEISRYQDFPKPTEAFRGSTNYAEWIRRRNAIVRLGDWLFAHGGIDLWALHTQPGDINSTVRAWVRYWQKSGQKPPDNTHWVVASNAWSQRWQMQPGPLWNRSFKVKQERQRHYHCPDSPPLPPPTLIAALQRWNSQRLVVGHSPIDSGEILLSHPAYSDRVIMIDTCISAANGTLSALCITANDAAPLYLKSRTSGRTVKLNQKRLQVGR